MVRSLTSSRASRSVSRNSSFFLFVIVRVLRAFIFFPQILGKALGRNRLNAFVRLEYEQCRQVLAAVDQLQAAFDAHDANWRVEAIRRRRVGRDDGDAAASDQAVPGLRVNNVRVAPAVD